MFLFRHSQGKNTRLELTKISSKTRIKRAAGKIKIMKSLSLVYQFCVAAFLVFSTQLLATQVNSPADVRQTIRGSLPSDEGDFRYQIHFKKAHLAYALRVEQTIELYAPKVFQYFNYTPRSITHFNVLEATTANGSAQVFPTSIVNLFYFPAASTSYLQSLDDWIEGLVIHELIHIVHVEQTRGVIRGLENVFGSLFRFGIITPRWFSEGIAVWGESYFLAGGRLYHDEILFELYGRLLDPHFCSAIDCLDTPEGHPGGHLPYWMGALFIDYLEREKQGAIACLVYQNSGNIPGFLNNAFRRCLGENAKTLFAKFRAQLVDEIRAKNKEINQQLAKNPAIHSLQLPSKDFIGRRKGEGVSYWESGALFYPQQVIYPITWQGDDYLVFHQIQDDLIQKKWPLKGSLLRLNGVSNDHQSFLFSLRGLDILGQARHWYSFDLESFEVQKLDFLKGVMEAFKVGDDYFAFSFVDNRWNLIVYRKTNQQALEVYQKKWPILTELTSFEVKKTGQTKAQIIIKSKESSRVNGKHDLSRYQFEEGRLIESESLFQRTENFRYHFSCGDRFVYSQDSELYLWEATSDSHASSDFQFSFFQDVPAIVSVDRAENQLFLRSYHAPGQLYVKELNQLDGENCQSFKGQGVSGQHNVTQMSENKREEREKKEVILYPYPSLSHFRPYFWMLSYAQGKSHARWSATTTLSDPLLRNNLDLLIQYYDPIKSDKNLSSEWAGTVNYRYAWHENTIAFGYQKEYFNNPFVQDDLDSSQNIFGRYSRTIITGRKQLLVPSISLMRDRDVDFVSDRTTQQIKIGTSFQRFPLRNTQRLQASQFGTYVFQSSEERENYLGAMLGLRQQFRLHRNFRFDLAASYGKMLNDELFSGVFFGGGFDQQHVSLNSVDFPFYGLEYSEIFGREIATVRAQGQWIYARPYRSLARGLFPFFTKAQSLLFGLESAYAEWIYLPAQRTFYRNDVIYSSHVGIRLDAMVVYLAPIGLDFLYTQTYRPRSFDRSDERFLLNIGISSF